MGLHVDFVAYTRCSHALATAECIELILKLFTSVPVWLHVIILSMHGNDDREREMTVVLCCVRGSWWQARSQARSPSEGSDDGSPHARHWKVRFPPTVIYVIA